MKKIALLFALAAMALSCSDDDNTPVSLDGTWKLTYLNTHIINPNLPDASENYIDTVPCMGNSTLSFGKNNTAIFIMGDNNDGMNRTAQDTPPNCLMKAPENVTYSINDNSVEFIYTSIEASPGATIKRTFSRSGNKLIVTIDPEGNEQYIPGSGEYGDSNNTYSYATFEFTKQ